MLTLVNPRRYCITMDLFKAYPLLERTDLAVLQARSLRLIAVAGLVYDEQAFYFELNARRNWGRLPGGAVVIGVGTPRIQPEEGTAPHEAVIRHVRQHWRCAVDLHPPGFAYVLDETGDLHVIHEAPGTMPHLFLMTPPRLGGSQMPDALVQAVYFLPVRDIQMGRMRTTILRVERQALMAFLAPEQWVLEDLRAQPWASLSRLPGDLPPAVYLRPILALRGLRRLMGEPETAAAMRW